MHTYGEAAWHIACQQVSCEAQQGAGCSETLWLRNLHAALAARMQTMEPDHQQQALSIAAAYGYVTPQKLDEDAQWNAKHGYCSHGIEPRYCPAGCGDLDEDQDFDR